MCFGDIQKDQVAEIEKKLFEIRQKSIEHIKQDFGHADWLWKLINILDDKIHQLRELLNTQEKLKKLSKLVESLDQSVKWHQDVKKMLEKNDNDLKLLFNTVSRIFGKYFNDFATTLKSFDKTISIEHAAKLCEHLELASASTSRENKLRLTTRKISIVTDLFVDTIASDVNLLIKKEKNNEKIPSEITARISENSQTIRNSIGAFAANIRYWQKGFINLMILLNAKFQEIALEKTVDEPTKEKLDALLTEYSEIKKRKSALTDEHNYPWFDVWIEIPEYAVSMLDTVFRMLKGAIEARKTFEHVQIQILEKHLNMEDILNETLLDIDATIGYFKTMARKLWKLVGGDGEKLLNQIKAASKGPTADKIQIFRDAANVYRDRVSSIMYMRIATIMKSIQNAVHTFIEETKFDNLQNVKDAENRFKSIDELHSVLITEFEKNDIDIDEFVTNLSRPINALREIMPATGRR